jgi:hypothetical protein
VRRSSCSCPSPVRHAPACDPSHNITKRASHVTHHMHTRASHGSHHNEPSFTWRLDPPGRAERGSARRRHCV